jgi:hypothetical protein
MAERAMQGIRSSPLIFGVLLMIPERDQFGLAGELAKAVLAAVVA